MTTVYPFSLTKEEKDLEDLRNKLKYAALLVRKGQYQAIRMTCFNRQEVEQGQAYMMANFPTVLVQWLWVVPLPGGSEITGDNGDTDETAEN